MQELGGENLTDESWFNNIGSKFTSPKYTPIKYTYIVVQLIEWLWLFIPGEDDNDYSLNIENDEDVDANKDLNPEGDL